MILAFKLTLREDGGDGKIEKIKTFKYKNTKTLREHINLVLSKSPYKCRMADGWVAKIDVLRVNQSESYKLQREFSGNFDDCDHMPNQIMWWQEISDLNVKGKK